MTERELRLLKSSVDQVVALETNQSSCLAQVLFVFDEGETPDMFYLEMDRQPDGSLVQRGQSGHSVLLADVVSVATLPG